MAGDVEVEDTPAIMTDDEEAVQEAEGDGGHREEVHGRNGFAMIAKKTQLSASCFWIAGCSLIQREMLAPKHRSPA